MAPGKASISTSSSSTSVSSAASSPSTTSTATSIDCSTHSGTYGTYCPPHMLSNINTPLKRDDYKAYRSTMPPNFRAMMNSGSLVLGVGCYIPSVHAARVVATLPHHFCWLDAEHTPFDYPTLTAMIRTINTVSEGRMSVVVRIPQNAPDLVTYCLNAGAAGICFPHLQNAEQARNLVDQCRFPPYGKRGHPPFQLFGEENNTGIEGKNTYDVWDEHVCCIAQIEDPEGVANIEEICNTPGIDALMVGAHDLHLELGIRPPGATDGDHAEFLDAMEAITRAASKRGKHGMAILGFSQLGDTMAKRIHRGWRAFKVTTDVVLVHQQGTKDFNNALGFTEETTEQYFSAGQESFEVDPEAAQRSRQVSFTA